VQLTHNDKNHVIVRKSTDSGSSWNTVLDYQFNSSQSTWVADNPVMIDDWDRIYIGANGRDSSAIEHWQVLRTSDGGVNWETIDDFEYVTGKSCLITSLGKDSGKNVYATGRCNDGTSIRHWLARKLPCK